MLDRVVGLSDFVTSIWPIGRRLNIKALGKYHAHDMGNTICLDMSHVFTRSKVILQGTKPGEERDYSRPITLKGGQEVVFRACARC